MFEQAKWICADLPNDSACPLFQKTITISKPIVHAEACVTALGIYNLFVNEARIGKALFAPGFTSYRNRLQYQTYDITEQIQSGNNTVGILCAPGWAVGYLGKGTQNHVFADHISTVASVILTYADGTVETVSTDGTWEVYTDRILTSEFYHGETVDYSMPKTRIGTAIEEADKTMAIIPNEGVPVYEHERLAPCKLIITPKGERVLDFGQNMAGYVEIRIKGKKGDRIVLSHAEVLDKEGNFYTKNLELAKCQNTYILSGEEDVCKPSFSFQGYRYVRLDEYPFDTVDLDCFASVALYSDMKRTGQFVCGNEKINRLYRNTVWGQRSNFIELPTDCPQRDERVGWTGDAQVFVRTAAINYDVEQFMKKWLNDVVIEQRADGAVEAVVPSVPQRGTRVSTAWGDAMVICPWEIYLAYGDLEALRGYYPNMCKWVDFIRSQGPEEYLWLGGNHYGDWLASDAELCPEMREGATQTDLIASAYFAHVTRLVIKAGKLLGEDVSAYEELLSNVKAAYRKTFLKDGLPTLYPQFDGLATHRKVLGTTQTGIVLTLHFELYEGEEERRCLVEKLVSMIEENGNRMTTGFVGTPYILHALTDNGYAAKAYDLFLQEKSPSWIFSVNQGATTIWEHWDSIKEDGSFWHDRKNSFNHYSYGSVFDWVYGSALGIRPLPEGAGYAKVDIEPHPDRRLGFAKGSIDTRLGKLEVSWVYEENGIRYEMEIPDGTVANVTLPDGTQRTYGAGCHVMYTKPV